MIFTILGSLSILGALVFFFIFIHCLPSYFAVNYFIYIIAFAVNGIVFFTLSKMKKNIEKLEENLEKHIKSNNAHENKFDSIETDIIKLKQKLNKKDGE